MLLLWRLIRDRFIAGHESCDLRRYLDCVPPDTPLRDIVDRCRVWESHADPDVVRRISKPMPEPAYPTYVVKQPDYETEPVCVVTVNKPNSSVDQSEEIVGSTDSNGSSPGEGPRIISDGEVSPTVIVGNSEERTGPSDAGRASGVENITSNVLRRTTIARDRGSGSDKYDVTGLM